MAIPDIPFDPVLSGWVAVVVALPVAFLGSLALIWLYLRAVKRSMLGRAAREPSRARLRPRARCHHRGVGWGNDHHRRAGRLAVVLLSPDLMDAESDAGELVSMSLVLDLHSCLIRLGRC